MPPHLPGHDCPGWPFCHKEPEDLRRTIVLLGAERDTLESSAARMILDETVETLRTELRARGEPLDTHT